MTIVEGITAKKKESLESMMWVIAVPLWQLAHPSLSDVRNGQRYAGVGTGRVDGSLGEERNESAKSKDRVVCLNGTSLRSVLSQSTQLPKITEFNKYLGSTLHSDIEI